MVTGTIIRLLYFVGNKSNYLGIHVYGNFYGNQVKNNKHSAKY